MAAGRITTIYKYTRYACDMVGPWQCYRYMAAIPDNMRMESTEKREYERKLAYWRRDMSELRKKFSDDYQRLMQSQLSSQEDSIEEERQRENVIAKMLRKRNRESSERREKKALEAREKAMQLRDSGAIKQQAAEEKFINKCEEIVSNELVESENFITKENIDQKLHDILRTTKDYNFAVYENGKIVKSSKSTDSE